jgi:hypothetical protein
MAWHIFIFPKSLENLEDFKENPRVQFLQNLTVQFSKVLPNPKFKRNLKRIFFFLSWFGSSFPPGAARGRAPMSSGTWQWPSVHGGLGWRGPQPRGPSPRISPSKNNSRKSNFSIFLGKFAEKHLELQTFITFQPQLQIQ